MVSESTWRVHGVLRFILARNYNGFVVDMDSLGQANLHFSKELQCFRGGHGFCETVGSESNRPRVLREQKVLPEVRNRPLLLREFVSFSTFEKLLTSTKRNKSGSGVPGPKSAPRDTKSATFAKGIFQPFDLPKLLPNPIREPSFS